MTPKIGVLRHHKCKHPDKSTVRERCLTFEEAESNQYARLEINFEDLDKKRIEQLAEEGFFLQLVAQTSILRCFYCGFGLCGLDNWNFKNECFSIEHRKRFPYCTFNKLITTPRGEPDKPEIIDEDSEMSCVVCAKHKLSVVLLPCGHTFCKLCSVQMPTCWICKRNIYAFKKIFFS